MGHEVCTPFNRRFPGSSCGNTAAWASPAGWAIRVVRTASEVIMDMDQNQTNGVAFVRFASEHDVLDAIHTLRQQRPSAASVLPKPSKPSNWDVGPSAARARSGRLAPEENWEAPQSPLAAEAGISS